MSEGVTTTLQDWKFGDQHVQVALNGSDFVSAQTTLIAAGPPKLESVGDLTTGAPVLALGVTESFSLQQQQTLQRVFEIGSVRSYLIPGVLVGGFNIGRLFIHGPSLLRSMYAAYQDGGQLPAFSALLSYNTDSGGTAMFTANLNSAGGPGYGDFFINLLAEIFKRPVGVAVYMQDRLQNNTGAFYVEMAMITTHQLGYNAGATIVAESASFEFDRIVPIDVRTASGPAYIEGV